MGLAWGQGQPNLTSIMKDLNDLKNKSMGGSRGDIRTSDTQEYHPSCLLIACSTIAAIEHVTKLVHDEYDDTLYPFVVGSYIGRQY